MEDTKAPRYINPYTDYGFKRLFGEEPSKDMLLDFLNELLREQEGHISDLSFLPNENLPLKVGDRKAIFDIYCTNAKGERFIVEMQKAEQKFFKDRTVFYSTFPIQEQAKGKDKTWDFELKHVYTIGILDFTFAGDESPSGKFRYDAKICELEDRSVFYDKLTYIYLSMPKFTKGISELETRFDKWMYVIKHLSALDRVPDALREKIFLKFFETAEISKLSTSELKQYESSLNVYRDIVNSINWAEEKGWMKGRDEGKIEGELLGIEKGKIEGKIEIALQMLSDNESIGKIMRYTGLTESQIEALKKEI
jgi:predicted transposase/invertase (TIGR01784 family)